MKRLLLLVVPMLIVVSACQLNSTMWTPCSPSRDNNPFGADDTYVLVCKDGRWVPVMTMGDYVDVAAGRGGVEDPIPTEPKRIAAGRFHSCSIRNPGGRVYCWGENGMGQLGNGTTVDSYTPVEVVGLRDAISVVAGDEHTCAVHGEFAVVSCWGSGRDGQTGPRGAQRTLTEPLRVYGFGGVSSISVGDDHTCAIDRSSRVWCWGDNDFGELGRDPHGVIPGEVVPVAGLSGALDVVTGSSHTCVLFRTGAVKCFGSNSSGQFGSSSPTRSHTPVAVAGLPKASAMSGGDRVTCVVAAFGTLSCFGPGILRGQEGVAGGAIHPVQLAGLSGVVDLAVESDSACAILIGGTMKCWGSNSSGELADGTTVSRATPGAAIGGGWIQVEMNKDHGCARRIDGSDWCWGRNHSGQVGPFERLIHPAPLRVN